MSSHSIGQAAPQAYLWFAYFINSIIRACALLLITYISITPVAHADNLPVINTSSSSGMSIEDEYRLGNIIAANIRKQLPLWNDLAALSFLNDLAQPLISHSTLDNKDNQIFLVRDDSINAFAAPGGIIGVHTGLIQQAGSVDGLVAVLAHEVAHLSLRHYVQSQAHQKARAPLYLGAFIASIWFAGNVNGDIGEAGVYATQSALQRSLLSYNRNQEREADRIGFDLMYRSPFDPVHMQHLLQRLQSPYTTDSPQWEWARSHPMSSERVADIGQRMVMTQKPHPKHGFQFSFELLQVYQSVTLSNSSDISVGQIMRDFDPLANHYGSLSAFAQALVNQRSGQLKLAIQQLQHLAQAQPNAALIWYNWMQALLNNRQTQEVFKQLKSRKLQRKESRLSLWIHAQALRQNNQPTAAINLLLKLLKSQPTWTIGWRTLAEWSAIDQRLQLNHMAQSHWHLLRGEAELALKQAHYASQQEIDSQAGSVSELQQQVLRLQADQAEFN